MNPPIYNVILLAFILGAYAAKILLIRSRFGTAAVFLFMVAGIGSTLPIFYLCSPAWTNRFMLSPLLIYFGEPVGIFAVPLASFIFDLATRPCTRLRSVWPFHLIRSIIEIAFILTYWAIAWEYAMLEFGWLWI